MLFHVFFLLSLFSSFQHTFYAPQYRASITLFPNPPPLLFCTSLVPQLALRGTVGGGCQRREASRVSTILLKDPRM